LNDLITANLQALEQALDLVSSLSDEAYRQRVDGRSQPGAHIRHVLDHYAALRSGLQSGVVDYDYRQRQSEVETHRGLAKNELLATSNWLSDLLHSSVDSQQSSSHSNALKVKSEVSLCDCCAVTVDSDLSRELLYTLNHTVHHMAYVALLLQINGISVNASIGVAPATASYRRSQLAS